MREYDLIYTPDFKQDLDKLIKSGDIKALQKLESLLSELIIHPKIGTGKPEQLSGSRAGQWSRRINQKHRLVYMIEEEEVIVLLLATYGHYEDK